MLTVRATYRMGGEVEQFRLYYAPSNFYVLIGPHAGPYATRAAAQAVADRLNAQAARVHTLNRPEPVDQLLLGEGAP